MNRVNSKLGLHFGFLVAFSTFMVGVWMLPMLLAGFPFVLSGTVLDAKEFAQTGLVGGLKPMVAVIIRILSSVVGWNNAVGWPLVTSITMALSLFPLWWSVQRLFDSRIAWLTVVIFSFMPIQWLQALYAGGYPFALLFLFLGFAFFLYFYQQSTVKAILLFAIFFGFTLASSHAFITFLPWICCAYILHNRFQWKSAIVQAGMFCVVAYVGLMLPLVPNALQQDMNTKERFAVFLPAVGEHTTGVGHLYPDYYAYEFLREEFDQRILERTADAHFLTRQQDKYVHWIFGVGDMNFFDGLLNGGWLFLHTFPELLLQEYLGGAFLWIFIILGMMYCFQAKRSFLFHFISLWICMELILRFVLHYGRTHLMDIGWGFALFAGVGIATFCDAIAPSFKRISSIGWSVIIVVIVSIQLTQANRTLFAHKYARSNVPAIFAATESLNALPEDAVVAHFDKGPLFYFSDRKHVRIHIDTIDYLIEQGELGDPFIHYGVTHILGYDADRTAQILKTVPDIKILTVPEEGEGVAVTPVIRYLLHLIR
jgi:hypothetical protein